MSTGTASLTGSRATPVNGDPMPPAQADVVIIGGGILGVCAAYFLVRRGVSVALCEKGVIGGEASCRSVGQVASAGLGLPKMALIRESKRLWVELNQACGGDPGYRRNGLIIPTRTPEELGIWESWLATSAHYESDARILNADETALKVPSHVKWCGAYFNPSDGTVEPRFAAPAIALAARRLGAKIHVGCAVRGVESTAGHVSSVITEKGAIRTENVVLAGGAWSTLFARSTGFDLPMLPIHASCQTVDGVSGGPDGTGDAPGVSWRREFDGAYTIAIIGGVVPIVPDSFRYGFKFLPVLKAQGRHWDLKYRLDAQFFRELLSPSRWPLDAPSPFERRRVLAPAPEPEFTRRARQLIVELLPAFQALHVREEWAGVLVVTPDNMPTISPVQSMPGMHLLTGFSYGLTMAPGAGKMMADLITGAAPDVDPVPYRYERYLGQTELNVVA